MKQDLDMGRKSTYDLLVRATVSLCNTVMEFYHIRVLYDTGGIDIKSISKEGKVSRKHVLKSQLLLNIRRLVWNYFMNLMNPFTTFNCNLTNRDKAF